MLSISQTLHCSAIWENTAEKGMKTIPLIFSISRAFFSFSLAFSGKMCRSFKNSYGS